MEDQPRSGTFDGGSGLRRGTFEGGSGRHGLGRGTLEGGSGRQSGFSMEDAAFKLVL